MIYYGLLKGTELIEKGKKYSVLLTGAKSHLNLLKPIFKIRHSRRN